MAKIIDSLECGKCGEIFHQLDVFIKHKMSNCTPKEEGEDSDSKKIKIASSFSVASQRLGQAEDTPKLESGDEIICSRPHKRTKKSFMYPGEESDGDCTPPPSQKDTRTINDAIPVPPGDTYPSPSLAFQLEPQTPPSSYCISPSNFQVSSNPGYTIMNGKLVAWMDDISVKVKQLEGKLDVILDNQAKILALHHQVPEKVEINENIEILGSLPVTDDESFMELNEKLLKENHLRHLLIEILISVGGKDMRFHIHNMLRRVISDEVAEIYTLSGKSTLKNAIKKPFLATEVSKSIFSACQRVFKDMATDVKIKEAVGDWLNQAKVRKIRRMQRNVQKTEKNTELL